MTKKNTTTILIACALLLTCFNSFAQDHQHNLRVDGITCPFCVATSAKALRKIDGVNKVDANIGEGIISVCADNKADLNDERLTQLFLDKGFKYRGKETVADCEIE